MSPSYFLYILKKKFLTVEFFLKSLQLLDKNITIQKFQYFQIFSIFFFRLITKKLAFLTTEENNLINTYFEISKNSSGIIIVLKKYDYH